MLLNNMHFFLLFEVISLKKAYVLASFLFFVLIVGKESNDNSNNNKNRQKSDCKNKIFHTITTNSSSIICHYHSTTMFYRIYALIITIV